MKPLFVVISLFTVILLAACGPLTPVPVPSNVPGQPQPATDVPPVLQPQATPVSGGGYPEVVLKVRAVLAEQLHLPLEQVQVSNIIPMEWPDTCLGLGRANESCGAMIVPGYQVVLSAGGMQFTFRADGEGTTFRQEPSPLPATGGEESRTLLEWNGQGCERFLVTAQAGLWGTCGESPRAVTGFDPGLEPVKYWMRTFAPFEAETSAGRLVFKGIGPNNDGFGGSVATPAEQRSMAEWAKLQFEAAQSGRTGAAWGLAMSYRREGGIAGFCDDVGIYLDGHVVVTSCKGLNASLYLNASELQQVYTWYDELAPIDYQHEDPAVADKMTTVMSMPGQGKKQAGQETINAILSFISELDARAAFAQQPDPQRGQAEAALVDFFNSLNRGDFAAGAKLYGGPTDLLQTWNPDIQNDLPAWLERACRQNGLVCLLPRDIRYHGPDSRGGYQFIVEFNQKDGTLFAQGPCCGDPLGQVNTSFIFSVIPQAGGWQVMDLPPYVP